MDKRYLNMKHLWIAAAFVVLSMGAGIGLGRIEPVGRKAGLIQFDAISELYMDEGIVVLFARYWVCQDFYALSVVWSEPHGLGLVYMKTTVILSDKTGLRIENEYYSDYLLVNKTYPKPFGQRDPLKMPISGVCTLAEMRFAESEALSRRVYVRDLRQIKDLNGDVNQIEDLNLSASPDGIQKKLARLKVRARGNRIESMDLLDGQQRPLGMMRYEYGSDRDQPRIARLVADLPVRPEKLAVEKNNSSGDKQAGMMMDVDHVSHKGGRTCTVAYKDVSIGDQVFRLPVKVEVRVGEDKRLLRSVRLMNFRAADLDKAAVLEAAKAFAGLGKEYWEFMRLVDKYMEVEPKVGPLQVDPNDLAFVRRLVAKYPLPERPQVEPPKPKDRPQTNPMEIDPKQRQKEIEAQKQEYIRSQELQRMSRPQKMSIDPNDLRVIRQLCAHYDEVLSPLTQEQKTELKTKGGLGPIHYFTEGEQEIVDLRSKLRYILAYHRVPSLPEDRPPEMEPNDLDLIRRLQGHYEGFASQQDRGLWDRLKAIHVLTRLDKMLKDYDAFEGHTLRYLRILQEAGLSAMYMDGGYDNIETLMEAGRYEKASQMMRQWADRSGADNDPDGIIRYARWHVCHTSDWWTGVHLLDRFLARTGLSPVQRYEGLALRAIALHKIDRMLAAPDTGNSDLAKTLGRWILSTKTRQEVARMVEPALRQALSAWQFLGEARMTDAKPYSTAKMGGMTMNFQGLPDATGLQETSALLDRIVRERTGQTSTTRSRTGR